ncbi:MAG: DUF4340 domain-containing protein [Planctomycetes bacterium]|nr:DUF4340 domain-containing protein [Planctomycetota bacterium]
MKKDINILFVITVSLIIVYLIQQSLQPKTVLYEKQITKLLSDVSTDEVKQLELYIKIPLNDSKEDQVKQEKEKSDKSAVNFLNLAGKWIMPSYYNAPANKQLVQDLIDTVRELDVRRYDVPPEKFKEFYVHDDKTLHIVGRNEKEELLFHLLVGKRLEVESGCYVRKAGSDAVYKTSRDITRHFSFTDGKPQGKLDPTVWVNKKGIIDVDSEIVEAIQLDYDNKKIVWVKEEIKTNGEKDKTKEKNYVWKLKFPQLSNNVQFKQDQINAWISELRNIQADEVVLKEDIINKGVKEANRILSVRIKGIGEPFVYLFAVLSKDEAYVLESKEQITYRLKEENLKKFFKPLGELVGLSVTSFDKAAVKTLEIETPYRLLRFEKVKDLWELTYPQIPFELNEGGEITGLIEKLSIFTAIDLYKPNEKEPIRFDYFIRLRGEGTEHILKFSYDKNKELFLVESGENIFQLNDFEFKTFFPELKDLVKWKIIDEDISFLRSIKLSSDNSSFEINKQKKNWVLSHSGYNFYISMETVKDLSWFIDNFVPKDIVNKAGSGNIDFKKSASVEFSLVNGKHSINLGMVADLYCVNYKDNFYEVNSGDYGRFNKKCEELCESGVFDFYIEGAAGVSIKSDKTEKPLDKSKLNNIKLKSVVVKPASMAEVHVIIINSENKQFKFIVSVLPEKSDVYYVTLEGGKYSLELDKTSLNKAIE